MLILSPCWLGQQRSDLCKVQRTAQQCRTAAAACLTKLSNEQFDLPLLVWLILLVCPSCTVFGYYNDVGVVSSVLRLQARQVCRRWHAPGSSNFPKTL